jgi:hypothetical protein
MAFPRYGSERQLVSDERGVVARGFSAPGSVHARLLSQLPIHTSVEIGAPASKASRQAVTAFVASSKNTCALASAIPITGSATLNGAIHALAPNKVHA